MNETIEKYRLKGIDLGNVNVAGTTIYRDWLDKIDAENMKITDKEMNISPEKAKAIHKEFSTEIERISIERKLRQEKKDHGGR